MTYDILVDGTKVATMGGDFAQASSQITMDGDSTPYQVADARHREQAAAEMLLSWAWRQGGAVCEMDDDGQPTGEVEVVEAEEEDAENE